MRNRTLIILALLAFASVVCFMTIGLRGNLPFVLSLRAEIGRAHV